MFEITRHRDGSHTPSGPLPPAKHAVKKPIPVEVRRMPEAFVVHTMEGRMEGKAGDWLITGVNGEMYPCDAEIFAKTYDVVD